MKKVCLYSLIGALVCFFSIGIQAQAYERETYYSAAVGQKKEALKEALRGIIAHADVLEYGNGSDNKTWYGFYRTDRIEGTNEVRDRYSNDHRYFNTSNPYASVGGMNIEHSLANSWWGGTKNQAYKDIHHLMPCESSINSSKGNYGMGKVTSVKTDNGCTKVGKGPGASGNSINMWEPADQWKGDFARVYFYMVTCYSNLTWKSEALNSLTNSDWPTLQPWAYELYLEWDQQDPIDDIERARNEAVYQIQNNRNPFIDIPNLAQYIWGDKTDVAFTFDGSDVPDPPTPVSEDSVTIISQNFKGAGMGNFTSVVDDGSQSPIWAYDSRFGIVGNAYNYDKTGDAWLITPTIDLTGTQGATLTFTHAVGYHQGTDPHTMFDVLVSTNYEQTPEDASWTSIDVTWPVEPSSATSKFTPFISSGIISLDEYAGSTINVAFHYTATSDACWAWELSDCQVKAKLLPVGINQNYMSPVNMEDAVFDLQGHYIGTTIPMKRGIYIVRQGGYTYKRFVK